VHCQESVFQTGPYVIIWENDESWGSRELLTRVTITIAKIITATAEKPKRRRDFSTNVVFLVHHNLKYYG